MASSSDLEHVGTGGMSITLTEKKQRKETLIRDETVFESPPCGEREPYPDELGIICALGNRTEKYSVI